MGKAAVGLLIKRQRKIEGAALFRLALQPHAPAMLEKDLVGDIQP